jgi:DNA-binding CsgD family transcriptional regulator/PAS domain-containing protein
MTQEQRALQLVELISAGAIDPASWQLFVERLSEVYGDAAVGLSLQRPGGLALEYYDVGLVAELTELAEKHVAEGLPWGRLDDDQFKGRFALASENFPDEDLPQTAFYREVMKPQGLAPEAPIVHVIFNEPDRPISGISIWRREGGRAFTSEDLALGNLLAPHLVRAFEIHRRFGELRNERGALAEVLDRLPVGVVLIDALRKPVVVNRYAEQIADLCDGFILGDDGPRASDPRENKVLRQRLSQAIAIGASLGRGPNHVMSVSRPSCRRAYPVIIAPLLAPPTGRTGGDAVAAIFIGDPEAGQITTAEFLQTLYALTQAEAELVALLARGHTLEEAAAERGVRLNTVRSQLKQVFAKTDTNRQGQLMRLVLTGVAGIQDEAD